MMFPTVCCWIGLIYLIEGVQSQDGTAKCLFDNGQVVESGEPLGELFETRCGISSEWPCFCDPFLQFQAYCPYCGFAAGDGTLNCARDGETISFLDGSVIRECFCEFTDDPSEEPIRNCTVAGGELPIDLPANGPFTGQCVLPDADGNLVEFENGESFGDLIEFACGPAPEWPSFCRLLDNEGTFDIEYPYCIYDDTISGDILCAEDGSAISYTRTDRSEVNCNCTYTMETGPESECDQVPDRPSTNAPASTPTAAPLSNPTQAPTISAGVMAISYSFDAILFLAIFLVFVFC